MHKPSSLAPFLQIPAELRLYDCYILNCGYKMSTQTSPVQTQSPVESYASPPGRCTRTVAIVKNHALEHRLEIESRMTEAGFEVSNFTLCYVLRYAHWALEYVPLLVATIDC